jgi:deazaflavin-dependent oxidoreductase (nitroreductase family)
VQDDDRAMGRIEAPKRIVEQLTVGEVARNVGLGGSVKRRDLDLHHASTTAPSEIEAGVDEEAMNPRVEARRVPETGHVPPRADERVLDGVARELRVAEDQSSGRVQPPDGQVDQAREGVMIAFPRPFDETSLIHALPRGFGTAIMVVLTGYGVARSGIVHRGPREWAGGQMAKTRMSFLRPFTTRVFNPMSRRVAGQLPGFGLLSYAGRKTGRRYRTPINVFHDGVFYVFALTYGSEVNWVQNVLAAGGAELRTRGRDIRLVEPELLVDRGGRLVPLPVRLFLRLNRVTEYLRMRAA